MVTYVSTRSGVPGSSRPDLTWHARSRMSSLRISEAEVKAILRNPLGSYPGGPRHGTGRVVLVGRSVLVVVSAQTRQVITVELHTEVPYVHGVHHRDNLPNTPTSPLAA